MPFRLMASSVAIATLAVAMSASAFAQSPPPEAGGAPVPQAQPSQEPAAAPAPEPAPAPSVAPAPRASAPHRRVAAGPARVRSGTNLRKGPGESYEVLTLIPAGGAVSVRSCSGEWCAVHWQGNEGYAIARNLEMGGRQAAYGPPGAAPPGYPPEEAPPPGYRYGPPVPAGPPGYYYGPPPPYYYRPYWGWGWGWRRW